MAIKQGNEDTQPYIIQGNTDTIPDIIRGNTCHRMTETSKGERDMSIELAMAALAFVGIAIACLVYAAETEGGGA